jgi:hypothetical protein
VTAVCFAALALLVPRVIHEPWTQPDGAECSGIIVRTVVNGGCGVSTLIWRFEMRPQPKSAHVSRSAVTSPVDASPFP